MFIRSVLFVSLLACLNAGSVSAQGDAGQAGEFLRFGAGAKAMGLGRAFTSVSDDASALVWNPAGLAALARVGGTFMFMHQPLREGASFNYLAGAIPLRLFFVNYHGNNFLLKAVQELKFGVGRIWVSLGDFERYDAIGNRLPDQASSSIDQSALYFSVSYPLNGFLANVGEGGFLKFFRGNLDLGLTTKFIDNNLFGFNGSATGLDIGLKYSHFSGMLDLGVIFRDVNSATISYGRNLEGDAIPSTATFGVSLRPPLPGQGLLFSFDYGFDRPGSREQELMFGLEYDLASIRADWPVKLRFGTNSSHESFTFGINFSPEISLDQDWMPYGDWTYANDRSAFDAVGTRYSFSVDRNPFTAKYWYLNGMAMFREIDTQEVNRIKKLDRMLSSFEDAQQSKNPGNRAYRFEAALRQADLRFLDALAELRDSDQSDPKVREKLARRLQQVNHLYSGKAKRFLREDAGKKEIDSEDYFRSFVYQIQNLILSGDPKSAIAILRDEGQSWGKQMNIASTNGQSQHADILDYLMAFALYKANSKTEALGLMKRKLPESPLAKYLSAHILFLQGEYAEVLATLDDFDLNDSRFPADIFLPLMNDRNCGDEILFLQAASMFQLKDEYGIKDCLDQFARIPRFLPGSDLAGFLMHDGDIMSRLFELYENKKQDELNVLLTKVIESYLKSFSDGTLNENTYTYNY